ncbi:hypothetical protein [Priestia megaterium]
MEKCNYNGCDKNATTSGTVFARNPEGGKDIPTPVKACDEHAKVSGFFKD